jgi:DNA-directed RNA polymerase beta subunit
MIKSSIKDYITMPTGRRLYANFQEAIEMPDLIEMQKDSYNWFIKEGLAELFDEVSPVTDFIGRNLEFYFELIEKIKIGLN